MNNIKEFTGKDRSRRFLARYALRRELEKIDGSEGLVSGASDSGESAEHVRSYDRAVHVGEVRLLARAERPTYVLVAQEWDEGSWLTLPFSGYADPANDWEMRVLVPGGSGLNVLQLWNCKVLLTATLAEGWSVTTVSSEMLEDSLSAWRASVGLGNASAGQSDRIGSAVSDSPDVIRDYLDEEKTNFRRVVERDSQYMRWRDAVLECSMSTVWTENDDVESNAPDWRLVAGEKKKTPSCRRAVCDVANAGAVVRIAFCPESRRLSIRVFDSDGKDTQKLDGWAFANGRGDVLAEVENGMAEACEVDAFDGVCCLVDSDGVVHELTVRSGV